MGQPTEAFDAYDIAGDREDLSNLIHNISPTETPFTNNIGRGKAKATYHEWQTDSLAAAATNAHIDGDDYTGEAVAATTRLGNYCQISKKEITVTRRANLVDKAGRKSELAYQIAKKGQELKRDVEFIITRNQASLAGNSTTASTTGSLNAWLTTNTSRGATGSDGGFSGGIVAAATTGTDRALTEDGLLSIIKDCYVQGGNPNMIMMSPIVKQLWSKYMFGSSARVATPYQDHGKSPRGGVTAVGAVDVYVSDFGTLDICPNRFMTDEEAYVLDTEYWSLDYLDSYKTEKIAKSGDSEKRHILVDYALVSKNEAASGVYADIDETAAVTAS
jgi:hypothetical protein